MVNLTGAVLGASISWAVSQKLDEMDDKRKAAEQEAQQAQADNTAEQTQTQLMTDGTVNTDVERQLQALNERDRTNNPPADAVYGWFSKTIQDLKPGGSTTIEISPSEGKAMEVERIEFTREDNHTYDILISGEQASTSNAVVCKPPQEVRNGQKVVAIVTNNTDQSGVTDRTTTLDFEAQVWGYPTTGGR